MPTFNAYQSHGSANVKMLAESSVDAHRRTAEAAAQLGHTALYRVFEVTGDSVTGERFVTSFSVLNGKCVEHKDVSIPKAHSWRN